MNNYNLVKDEWTSENFCKFYEYLKQFKNSVTADFTKKVYNTEKECLAIKIPILRNLANEIFKGNYLSFIGLCHSNIIELNLIKGILICKISDNNLKLNLLQEYAKTCDSWCETDIIKFKINKDEEDLYFNQIKTFLNSEHIFVRRLGVILLFNFIGRENYINKLFNEIIKIKKEKEYYVNMAISWFLCECFIKQRNKTINFLKNNINKLNNFVINKFISKCCDSFRIKEEDKNYLKLLKNK